MSVIVRRMRPEEGRTFLEIHGRSVRGLAAQQYPPEVIEDWAGQITDERVRRFLKNPEREIRLIAELDGELVGLGALLVQKSELRACYVVPEAARKGLGTALVTEIERIARERGLTRLELESSLNAEPFYTARGYVVIERGEHELHSGRRMTSVTMRKDLFARQPNR